MNCIIKGCNNIHYSLGYCHRHYQRNKTGRMDKKGNLWPLPIKTKICESCGVVFELMHMERNVKWCSGCRRKEYSKIQTENNHGIYRRGQREETIRKKYIISCLNVFLKKRRGRKRINISRDTDIINFRQSGMTESQIGEIFNITQQRVNQITQKACCQKEET